MTSDPDMLSRLERDTLRVLALLTIGAVVARPDDFRLALGVLGGGGLMALSYLALRAGVAGMGPGGGGADGERPRFGLVKVFTRHGILALAAYGMMVRLHLDPLGMLVGVSSPVAAAAVEALRALRPRNP